MKELTIRQLNDTMFAPLTTLADVQKIGKFTEQTDASDDEYIATLQPASQANLALDYFGFAVDQTCDFQIDQDSAARVLQAARIVFAAFPGHVFTFDASSAWSWCGSPWAASCATPEEWVLNWARRSLERDECSVPVEDLDEQQTSTALSLIADLIAIGLTPQFLNENLECLTYCESADGEDPEPHEIEAIIKQNRESLQLHFCADYLNGLSPDDTRREMLDPAVLEAHLNNCEAMDREEFAERAADNEKRRQWLTALRSVLGWAMPV